MPLSINRPTFLAILLSVIAAISAMQGSGIFPGFVSGNDSLSISLSRASSSTESASATATVEINLNTGLLTLDIRHGTPGSIYALAFVSGSANAQLGVLATAVGGEANLQTTLSSGVYAGRFELTRNGILQMLSAAISLTVGMTASVSTAQTSTTTSFQTTASSQTVSTSTVVGGAILVEFQVDPSVRSISAGSFAKFNIRIKTMSTSLVFLVAKGVPASSVAIFTPNVGTADLEFHSSLTVLTSTNTPIGTYPITMVALINNQQEFNAQAALQVTAPSTTTSTATSISVGAELSLTLTTDQSSYTTNTTVNLRGYVSDDTGSAASDANVSVQIDSPTGVEVFVSQAKTDGVGSFHFSFKLPMGAISGTYTVFASARKVGYASATTHITFVVGSTSTPSVIIKAVYAGDSAGNPLAVFSSGQTVYVWLVAQNSGATFQGVIWVQIRDPSGVPVSIQIRISVLNSGETVTDGFGLTFLGKPATGLYTVNALVSDKLISQGGTFLASADTTFAITG